MKNLTLLLAVLLLCGCAKAQIPNPLSCKNTRDINEYLNISIIAENRGVERDALSLGLQLDTASLISWSPDAIVKSTKHEVIFKESENSKWGNYIVTLNDLLEYETECYNDSSILYNYMIECWNGMEFDTTYSKELINIPESYITSVKIYYHKEPTLKGFIKWLKNK